MLSKSYKFLVFVMAVVTLFTFAGTAFGTSAFIFSQGQSAAGNVTGEYSYNGLTYNIVDGDAVIMYSSVSGNVVIPDEINGYPVTEIAAQAFQKNDSITSLTVGNNVLRIGNNAFWNCKKLSKVVVGNSVKEIGDNCFEYCVTLSSITLSDSILKIGNHAFNSTAFHKNTANWTDKVLYIGKHLIDSKADLSGSYSIKNGTICIADCALRNCDELKSVVIPNTVRTIGFCAFEYCDALTSVAIPDSVQYIFSYAFKECPALSSISIGKNVKKIDSEAFVGTAYYNKASNWTENVLYIGKYLIEAKVNEIVGSYTVKDGTIGIAERAFCDAIYMTDVKLPESLKYIGMIAFSNCLKVKTLNIPKSVEYIGMEAFIFCKIDNIYINDIASWCRIEFENADSNPMRKVKKVYIDNKQVTEITIPETVKSIGEYAFAGFSSLKTITLPDSVGYIGRTCFNNCSNVVIKCNTGSYADTYAQLNGIATKPLCEHSYGSYTYNNDATCTADGTKSTRCTLCGSVKTAVAEGTRLDHVFTVYTSNEDATCMADGTKTAYCDYGCGTKNTESDKGSIRNHSFTVYIPDNNTTCQVKGTKTAYCDYGCGKTDIISNTYSDHKYTSYVFNNDSDCINDGTKTALCDYGCGTVDTVTAEGTAKGHSFCDWEIIIEPTYEADGLKKSICSECGEVQTDIIPELTLIFTDVKDNHWFAASVKYCLQKGYVSGMTETTFVPNGKLTRAQFLTILAKLDGVDLRKYHTANAGFNDVKTSHWYNEVVCWAVEKGITSGLSKDKFGPKANVTRAQLARFFYVYSENNGVNTDGRADISAFPDVSKVASWAKTPIEWAVNAGLISGVAKNGINYLDPNGTATRAQATVMFKAYDSFCEANN